MLESRPASHIIFDLDGTLVQTRVASWAVFRQVNTEFNLGVDDEEKYFALLKGNLFERMRQLCESEEKADAAIESFMTKLGSDYFPDMIPGMVDVIHALAPRSTLAVLSSNHTSVIRRVLTGNGVEFCFAHVFGGDVEPDKTLGIRRFVADAAQGAGRRCSAFYDESAESVSLAENQTVLVTDTVGDIEAAFAAGIRAVGVSWGMHSEAQLMAAGAEFVAVWPQELVSYLRASESSTEVTGPCDVTPRAPSGSDSSADAASIRVSRRYKVSEQKLARVYPAAPATISSGGSCGCEVPPSVVRDPMLGAAGIHPVQHSAPLVSDEFLDAMQRIMR
jgi:phosphoglycolate phosphatase